MLHALHLAGMLSAEPEIPKILLLSLVVRVRDDALDLGLRGGDSIPRLGFNAALP